MLWWREYLKKQTNLKSPQTKSTFIRSSSGAAFFCLTSQRRGGCFGKLAMQKGERGKKTSDVNKCTVREVTTIIWAVAAADVGDREGTRSPHQTWPQHLLKGLRAGRTCCSPLHSLFMLAPFRQGFPGIAQSVTFVCFLRSALLNYFLSKRPRNLIGEMRRWARPGRIIKKNCHFPGWSFVGLPAFWDKDTAAGLGSVSKSWFGCLIIYEI